MVHQDGVTGIATYSGLHSEEYFEGQAGGKVILDVRVQWGTERDGGLTECVEPAQNIFLY